MYRIAVYALLVSGFASFAQSPQPMTIEPPLADSVLTKPASSNSSAPGQQKSFDPTADPNAGAIKQAQYAVPVPAARPTAQPVPTVLYPEPPTPMVKIAVKGVDTAPTGQELSYVLTVSNSSAAKAHHVVARCPVPRGATLVKALPQPVNPDAKELEWNLETLEPGAKRVIEVVFRPDDGATEIAVVGKVQFEHGRVIKTKLAKPTLDMKKTGPAEAILNDAMSYKIVVRNPGKVAVTDIQIVDTLPDGLEYVRESAHGAVAASKVGPGPNQRTWILGTLKPNESRTLEYRVMPRKIGDWTSDAVVTATGVQMKAGCNTVVQEARITLQVNGPKFEKATANQPTPFLVIVHNTGTAALHNIRVSCTFPTEMRLARASSGGHMFHDAVQWIVPKLGPKESKELSLSLIAPSAGLREVAMSAQADHGLEQRQKVKVAFEGIATLNWQAEGTAIAAPGQEIVYTITVKNPGSATAKNVKIVADLPQQVELSQAQPTFQRGTSAVFFNPVDIPAKETVTFKVIVVARKSGEARFQFELNAEGMSSGPLKNTRATTISPSGEPKNADLNRTASAPAAEKKKPEANPVVPAGNINPIGSSSPPAP